MNFLQSKNWRDTKQSLGNKVYEVGEYFFHTTPLPFLGKSVGYMPRPDINKVNWYELYKIAKISGCIYITIDPQNLITENIELPKEYKFEKGSPVHLQHTVMIDLSKSEDELLAAMKQKHRYNLNLAQKKGVKVKISNDEDAFAEFLSLYQLTVFRQRYHGRNSEYLKTVWENFKDENAFIATAYYENTPIVSWLVISYEDTLTYVYGGSGDEYKNVMAPYLLEWELVKLGKQFNYKYLDLFGIKEDRSDGYSRFKVGFGGEIVEYAETIDFVLDLNLYKLIKIAGSIRKKLIFK